MSKKKQASFSPLDPAFIIMSYENVSEIIYNGLRIYAFNLRAHTSVSHPAPTHQTLFLVQGCRWFQYPNNIQFVFIIHQTVQTIRNLSDSWINQKGKFHEKKTALSQSEVNLKGSMHVSSQNKRSSYFQLAYYTSLPALVYKEQGSGDMMFKSQAANLEFPIFRKIHIYCSR